METEVYGYVQSLFVGGNWWSLVSGVGIVQACNMVLAMHCFSPTITTCFVSTVRMCAALRAQYAWWEGFHNGEDFRRMIVFVNGNFDSDCKLHVYLISIKAA